MPLRRDVDNIQWQKSKPDQCTVDEIKCSLNNTKDINVPKKMNYDPSIINFPKKTQKQIIGNNTINRTDNTNLVSAARNEWLLDLCCSLQKSALEALRLSNERYEATLELYKQQVAVENVMNKENASSYNMSNANYLSNVDEKSSAACSQHHHGTMHALPPTIPPRHMRSQPPPLPPPPSSHLRQKILGSSIKSSHEVTLRQSLNTPSSVASISTTSKAAYDYRNSPSSGFYSWSAGSPSPSSTSIEVENVTSPVSNGWSRNISRKPCSPLLKTQFVKSIQVARPMLQTASAPVSHFAKDPPSYARAMQQREDICPKSMTAPMQHHSPIPERKARKQQKDCKIRNYSPQAFKFFMEQHVENVMKSYRQRIHRRTQLENEMSMIGLSDETRDQMRQVLYRKESNYLRLKRAKMEKSMFISIKVIGVGAFGEVSLVRKTGTKQLYAMKTLGKADVLKRKQVAHVKAERDILAEADNEWVVKLYYSFQDNDNLYFIMEYIPGGDLMSLLIKFGIFEESLAKFYLAELTCAVDSVHKIGFIHRDIKPDNILIDQDGHIKLTDFGLCTGFRWTHNSKYYNDDGHNSENSLDFTCNARTHENASNCKCIQSKPLERQRRQDHQRCQAHSLVGTPNYIAPEVLLRSGYTQMCDWWSVGVVLYEMLIGSPPFSASSPAETQHKIINWKSMLKIPPNSKVSSEGIDLILKLCTDHDHRLGKNVDELKQHPFFTGIDFKNGVRKTTPPYIPNIHYITDTSNFDPIDLESLPETNSVTSKESKPFHGFFEFTFRRFFDDAGGGVPFRTETAPEESDNRVAIYV